MRVSRPSASIERRLSVSTFWLMPSKNPKAVYACINLGDAYTPDNIAARSICIDGDVGAVLEGL